MTNYCKCRVIIRKTDTNCGHCDDPIRDLLLAIDAYGTDWHTGQASDWYRRQCLAKLYLKKWYGLNSSYGNLTVGAKIIIANWEKTGR